nr:glycine betaine ABC transporter substrate-binding protein [Okeania sp. SIO2B3]
MRLFVESRPCYKKTITRYQEGKPILYYASQPEWIFSALKQGEDVVWLEVPFTLDNLTEKDTLLDRKNLGFPIVQQRIVANKKFLEANPVVKRWLELVQIPLADLNVEELRIKEAIDRLENNVSDFSLYRLEIEKIYSFLDRNLGSSHRQAKKWVKNNQQQFDRWLKEAKQMEAATTNQG